MLQESRQAVLNFLKIAETKEEKLALRENSTICVTKSETCKDQQNETEVFKKRKDRHGKTIKKGGQHKIKFDVKIDVVTVENYKQFNKNTNTKEKKEENECGCTIF